MKPFLPKPDMPGWREISVVLPPQTINFYAWQDMLSQRKDNVSLKKAAAFFMWFWWHLSLSNLGYRNSFLVLYFFLILFVSIILVWYVEIPLPLLDGKASSFTWAGKVTNKTYSMLISMHGLHWLLKLPNYFWPLIKTTDRKPYRFLWENNNSQFGYLCLPRWLHTWSFSILSQSKKTWNTAITWLPLLD